MASSAGISKMNSDTPLEGDEAYFDDPGPNDVEEGELPEEGEIMDDEEDERVHADNKDASSSHRRNTTSSKSTEKTSPETTNNESSSKQASSLNVHESTSRKRHSASPGAEGYPPKRAAREPSPERFPPQLPPRRRQPWTEAILCKFFREGYCRDGDNCAYSHDAAHSNRKPELCKFYQQGFCKKGLACTLLHGEYPCKAYHQGKCDRSPCKYSHMPLNEYTQGIFDQMVQDEALAAQIVIPQQPARRKVLLPRPAPSAPSSTPPTVTSVPEEKPIPEPFDPMDDPDEKLIAEEAEPYPVFPPAQTTPQNQNGFSFGAMLEEMSNVKGAAEPNNPAGETWRAETLTPEERVSPGNPKPELKNTVYRLIPIADTDTDYDIDFLQKLSADRFKNDPRIQSLIQKQFDRASTMFGQNMPPAPVSNQDNAMAAVKVEKSAASRDPRMRPSSDPRQRPTATTLSSSPVAESISVVPQIIEANFDVHAGIPLPSQPVTAMDEAHLKTLAEKQLQMIKGQGLQPESAQGGFGYSDSRYPDNRNYRSSPDYYNYDRRDSSSARRYEGGFERGYNDYGPYESDYRNSRSSSSSRGSSRGRGYYENDRRDYHSKQSDRFDRWESRGGADNYRRDRDKPSRSRMRSRSRSPRPSKSNEYQSPLARA